jgi:hypothetical protein
MFFAMAKEIQILKVEKDGEDGLIVTFSDGTIADMSRRSCWS